MFIMTFEAQTGKPSLKLGLSPRSLAWVLVPKTLLVLTIGLVTGTFFLEIIRLWQGFWPDGYIWADWLLAGFVIVFWNQVALAVGLIAHNYMAGAVESVQVAMIIFFIGGGLSMVRAHRMPLPGSPGCFPIPVP